VSGARPTSAVISEAAGDDRRALLAFDTDTLKVREANAAAAEMFGRGPSSMLELKIPDLLMPDQRAASEAAVGLLKSGSVDGYLAARRFRRADGTEFTAKVWVRLSRSDGMDVAVVRLEVGDSEAPLPLSDSSIRLALAVTDHDWAIEHASSDAEQMLGVGQGALKGAPLLAMIRPQDIQRFMLSVARVSSDGGAAAVRLALRSGTGDWRQMSCLVVALCRHDPPRLGVAFATYDGSDGQEGDGAFQVAARGPDALDCMARFRSTIPYGGLSSRQWEIVTRLIRGERVVEIARALHLSPSTVRNHLTAVYRKFAVHSQAELLAELLRSSAELRS
jgi:PAS domain S-box-containing protein